MTTIQIRYVIKIDVDLGVERVWRYCNVDSVSNRIGIRLLSEIDDKF